MKREKVDAWMALSRGGDVAARRQAIRELCPCQVRVDHSDVWMRCIEMTRDPDVKVRRHALHALCDGSPRAYEGLIVAALEAMRDDSDPKLRRRVRKVLASHRRDGNLNVL